MTVYYKRKCSSEGGLLASAFDFDGRVDGEELSQDGFDVGGFGTDVHEVDVLVVQEKPDRLALAVSIDRCVSEVGYQYRILLGGAVYNGAGLVVNFDVLQEIVSEDNCRIQQEPA